MTQQNLKWRVNSNFLPTSFYFQHVRIIFCWIKFLDKITVIPRISLTDHFLILTLLNTTLRQCLKDCNIFHRPCRLVRLRTLIFTPKKSNEIFLNFFSPDRNFFWLGFCHFSLLFVYGKAEWQCIPCEIAAEIIGRSFSNITVVSFRQEKIFWTFF